MEDLMDMDMNPFRPQSYLFGCALKADKDHHFTVANDENEHQSSLRMVSLGMGTEGKLHIVEAEAMNYEGSPIRVTLATLKMLKCGPGPVHISGLHMVTVEEYAESEDKNEEDVKVLRMSGKRSASGDGSKVPKKQLRLDKEEYDKDDNEEEEDDFDEEETEEKVPVKKSV
ncbi:hypothetical protein U0070_012016 [Myodes glareolus]|uniref:Nucleophosmin n=1 Tax=Myodes glareolus TaxID=447135 RepID=A0AAW0HER7_MYOGA